MRLCIFAKTTTEVIMQPSQRTTSGGKGSEPGFLLPMRILIRWLRWYLLTRFLYCSYYFSFLSIWGRESWGFVSIALLLIKLLPITFSIHWWLMSETITAPFIKQHFLFTLFLLGLPLKTYLQRGRVSPAPSLIHMKMDFWNPMYYCYTITY